MLEESSGRWKTSIPSSRCTIIRMQSLELSEALLELATLALPRQAGSEPSPSMRTRRARTKGFGDGALVPWTKGGRRLNTVQPSAQTLQRGRPRSIDPFQGATRRRPLEGSRESSSSGRATQSASSISGAVIVRERLAATRLRPARVATGGAPATNPSCALQAAIGR